MFNVDESWVVCYLVHQFQTEGSSLFTGTVNQNGSGDVIVNGDIGTNATGTVNGIINNNNGDGTTTNNNNSGQIIVDGSQTPCMSMVRQPVLVALVFMVVLFALLFLGTLVLFIRERRLRSKTMVIAASDRNMEQSLVSRAEPMAESSVPGMEHARVYLDVRPRRHSEQRAQSPWSIRPPSETPPGYA
ncbi:hypothetical protein MSAN_00773100 [Mycena sanguinolenta]|uniref:Uncharacterized protein n=1 Tax=Mycena sanguinolenta TaxID=230812 RepID=A0A8H7DGH3_9AGAR|nr:hypothetical protein MSAN_00773100 [Mycena sanguinolenta]